MFNILSKNLTDHSLKQQTGSKYPFNFFDKKRHSHKTNRNDAPIKSSVLYTAARKLRHIPDANDKEGVYRVWDPKEESQSIDMNLKRKYQSGFW